MKYCLVFFVFLVVVGIVGYYYLCMFESWKEVFLFFDGVYIFSGVVFNEVYCYVDWLIIVFLFFVEFVVVFGLSCVKLMLLFIWFIFVFVFMFGLGYLGDILFDIGMCWFWWVVLMIFFFYIFYVLFNELG